jgi:hypothetical protein
MSDNRAHVQVYSTRIPIEGWGSLALLGIAAAIAMAMPEARFLMLAGVSGGAAAAALLIRYRQSR